MLKKQAIEIVDPKEMNTGFYSTLFLVPKKERGNETSDKLETPQRASLQKAF